jgi:hypothetical protein
MRTTLSLDSDVAAALKRLQARRDSTWKALVNDALRAGIRSLEAPEEEGSGAGRTEPVSLGRPRMDITNVHDALAAAEGDGRP